MKKLSVLFVLILICASFCSCMRDLPSDGTLEVVCLSFPEYDWARNVIGERNDVTVTLLRRGGVDLHSYQPTAGDLMDICDSDLFIYIGSPSFSGFKEALSRSEGTSIDLLGYFESDEGHGDDHDHGDDHGHGYEGHDHTDEHIWLSLSHAIECVGYICNLMCEIDPVCSDEYIENANQYIKKLESLDAEYRNTVENAATNKMVFADRYPFTYMASDYSLECCAAFSGCSGESAASFDTLEYLISSVEKYGLDCILTIEGDDKRLAETVAASVSDENIKILSLNSMQTMGKGTNSDYISVMKDNLGVLKEALG